MIYKKCSNEYLNLYAVSQGISEGDEIDTPSYLVWIDLMHNKFQRTVCGSEVFKFDKEYAKKFTQWLKGEVTK